MRRIAYIAVALVALSEVCLTGWSDWWNAAGGAARRSTGGTDFTVNLQHYWDAATGGTNDLGTGDNDISTLSPWTIGTDGYTNVTGSSGQTMALRTAISNGTTYTIAAWINADKTSMDANPYGGWIISDRGTANDFQSLYYKVDGALYLSVWATDGNAYYYGVVSNWVAHRTWQHVCFVVNGATGSTYTNGILHQTVTITGKTPRNVATSAAVVGNAIATDAPWRGILDKVRFYADAKTGTFVLDLFNSEKGSKGL